jgi:phage terminase large subunit GpA-like protein
VARINTGCTECVYNAAIRMDMRAKTAERFRYGWRCPDCGQQADLCTGNAIVVVPREDTPAAERKVVVLVSRFRL